MSNYDNNKKKEDTFYSLNNNRIKSIEEQSKQSNIKDIEIVKMEKESIIKASEEMIQSKIIEVKLNI